MKRIVKTKTLSLYVCGVGTGVERVKNEDKFNLGAEGVKVSLQIERMDRYCLQG